MKSALKSEFGCALRKLREAEGWTQEELAKTLCVTQSLISQWESGEAYPIKIYHDQLCEYLPGLKTKPEKPNLEQLGIEYARALHRVAIAEAYVIETRQQAEALHAALKQAAIE